MRKNLPLFSNLTDDELGLEDEKVDVDSVEDSPLKIGLPQVQLQRIDIPKPKSTA